MYTENGPMPVIGKLLFSAPFVGRGHDPADQVAHFALVRFNESAFVSLRFGGVMTLPYDGIPTNNNLPICEKTRTAEAVLVILLGFGITAG